MKHNYSKAINELPNAGIVTPCASFSFVDDSREAFSAPDYLHRYFAASNEGKPIAPISYMQFVKEFSGPSLTVEQAPSLTVSYETQNLTLSGSWCDINSASLALTVVANGLQIFKAARRIENTKSEPVGTWETKVEIAELHHGRNMVVVRIENEEGNSVEKGLIINLINRPVVFWGAALPQTRIVAGTDLTFSLCIQDTYCQNLKLYVRLNDGEAVLLKKIVASSYRAFDYLIILPTAEVPIGVHNVTLFVENPYGHISNEIKFTFINQKQTVLEKLSQRLKAISKKSSGHLLPYAPEFSSYYKYHSACWARGVYPNLAFPSYQHD